MTNNINRVGIGTNGVNNYSNPKPSGDPKPEDKTEGQNTQPQGNNVNPEDVYKYLAQTALTSGVKVTPAKVYDINKYVTPEQAERIAGFINSFEDEVANGLLAIDQEMNGIELPESVKLEIAARMAESKV